MSDEDLLRRHHAGASRDAAADAHGASAIPSLHAVVVTCMDTRIDPLQLFASRPGELHVLRNAGGVVTDDVARSLVISQRKLQTRHVLLVQHTGCGLATFTDDDFSEELSVDVGSRPPWRAHTFTDPVVSVRRGMTRLRRDPFLLTGSTVRGFVLDIATFALDEVFVKQKEAPSFV